MEPEFKEYDMVKVVKLLMPNDKRGNMGAEDIRRDPVVGDSGAIVHVHSVIEGLEQAYMVECCDQNGRPYWLADFLESELQMANIFEPPDKIDGAKVIWWAYSSEKPFFIMKYSDGLDYKPIHGFAICRYKDFGEVYRFSCDAEWNTANDAVYNDIEQAISDINNQFQEIHWYKKE